MNELIKAAVVGLATTRLTALVQRDEITRPLREGVGRWADGAAEGTLRDRLNYMVNCTRCVSVWAGAATVALEATDTRLGEGVNRLLAASQVALLILRAEEEASTEPAQVPVRLVGVSN